MRMLQNTLKNPNLHTLGPQLFAAYNRLFHSSKFHATDAGGGGAGSPNPSGSKDSGPCCPKAGKEMTRRRALATKRLLFDILSVNDANLIP